MDSNISDPLNPRKNNESEEFESFRREYEAEMQFKCAQPETSFIQLIKAHIARNGYSVNKLCRRTLLSEKTFYRIKTNQMPNPSLKTVMSLCIGLQLDPAYSTVLLAAAGYTLTDSPLHIAYRRLLISCYNKPIHICNEFLINLGFE